jgi:hypothetical protein
VTLPPRLGLSPRAVRTVLIGAVIVLLVAHVGFLIAAVRSGDDSDPVRVLFDLYQKVSVPNWFASFDLLIAALLLAGIAARRREARDPDATRWWWLAVGFAAMSLDRIACVHQLLNTFSKVSWEIPGAFICLAIGLAYVPFIRRLPARTRGLFVLAGGLYVFGVIVAERLGNMLGVPVGSTADEIRQLFDEGPQILGVAIFVYALLDGARGTTLAARPGRSLIPLLVIAGIALIAIHLGFAAWKSSGRSVPLDLDLLFDLEAETTVPSWFMATISTLAALLCFALGQSARSRREPGAWHWFGIAAMCLLLSIDQVTSFQDLITGGVLESTAFQLVTLAALLAVYAPFLFGAARRAAAPLICAVISFALATWGMPLAMEAAGPSGDSSPILIALRAALLWTSALAVLGGTIAHARAGSDAVAEIEVPA